MMHTARVVAVMASSNAKITTPTLSACRGAGAQGALYNGYTSTAGTSLRAWLRQHDFLLDDLNAVRDNNTTALMHAARMGRADLIRELLILGAQHQACNADGNNALWLACFSDDRASIAALLEANIDIDNLNDNGSTCLMYAASAGKADVVAQLLAAGANVALENLDGFTALDMAASLECLRLLRGVAQLEKVQLEPLAMDGAL